MSYFYIIRDDEGKDCGRILKSSVSAITRWASYCGEEEMAHGCTVYTNGGAEIVFEQVRYEEMVEGMGWNDE